MITIPFSNGNKCWYTFIIIPLLNLKLATTWMWLTSYLSKYSLNLKYKYYSNNVDFTIICTCIVLFITYNILENMVMADNLVVCRLRWETLKLILLLQGYRSHVTAVNGLRTFTYFNYILSFVMLVVQGTCIQGELDLLHQNHIFV